MISSACRQVRRPTQRWQFGSRVRIRTGPLAGLRGMIVKSTADRRLVVAMDQPLAWLDIIVPQKSIEPIHDQRATEGCSIRVNSERRPQSDITAPGRR